MAYAYETVKDNIGFDYANIDNPEFLASLHYVRNENSRLIYEIRFPNAPIDYQDSLILSLKDGKLNIYDKREFHNGVIKVTPVTVNDLVQSFLCMGVYDKFVASCFISCAKFIEG